MAATIYYDKDVDANLIMTKNVGIVGYGSQGHAHALNLKDNGGNVRVGLRADSKSIAKAEAEGLQVMTVPALTQWADVLMILAPDTKQPMIYEKDIAPNLSEGMLLMFGHGFNVRYETIVPPANVGVSLLAPKSPGHRVRETFVAGGCTPGLMAVHQDPAGDAKDLSLSYAAGIGCTRAGVIETTFKEETETDLFGEQAVLCGGASELVKAGFKVLVEAGYQPEVAYFECLHELKLIVDLMYRGGLNYMRYSVSDTAEYGDYHAGPQIITEETVGAMRKVLTDIQDGTFARAWIEENASGRANFEKTRMDEQDQLLEKVGLDLRSMMAFIDPVTIKPGE